MAQFQGMPNSQIVKPLQIHPDFQPVQVSQSFSEPGKFKKWIWILITVILILGIVAYLWQKKIISLPF
jgi:hypothetical protein